jgi:hypothetical protein
MFGKKKEKTVIKPDVKNKYFSANNFVEKIIDDFEEMKIYEPQKQWIIEKIKDITNEEGFTNYTEDRITQKIDKIVENSENEFLDKFLGKLSLFLEYGGLGDIKLNKFDRKKLVYFRAAESRIDTAFEPLFDHFGVDNLKELLEKFGANAAIEFKRYFSKTDFMKDFAAEFRNFVKQIESL